MTNYLINFSTQTLGKLKRNRRIVPTPPSGYNLVKVNLGSGFGVTPGWINIDGSLNALISSWPNIFHRWFYHSTSVRKTFSLNQYCFILENNCFIHHNLNYGIPFINQSVDFVYSSHFIEHLFKKDAITLLNEMFRVLKPGGGLRIGVPDLSQAISLYQLGEKEKMLKFFFPEESSNPFESHKYMYDFPILKSILENIGFKEIQKCEFRKGKCPNIEQLDNRPDETLFVEAKKL